MKTEIKSRPKLRTMKGRDIPHLLEPGEVGAVLELIVRDKDGKIIEQRVTKSESFLRAFIEILFVLACQRNVNDPYSVRDTGNTMRTITARGQPFYAYEDAGIVTQGIRVGTGNTAPTINDYTIETPIAHGTGGGQLQYGAMSWGAPSSDATTSQFTVTRNFANGSGGAIVVEEVGLQCRAAIPASSTEYPFLIIRDVIAGGINVPSGQTLTVNYRLQASI